MVNYVCTLSQSEMEKYFEWIIVIVLQLTIIFHNFVAVILGQKKIKDRFENLNKKKNRDMRKLFIQEGQEVPEGKPGRKKAIHPSSVIPAIPEGVTDDTYNEQRKQITEWRKSKKNYSLLKEFMSSTFPIRRQEVLTQNVRVGKIMEDFPNFPSSSGNELHSFFSCKLEPISTVHCSRQKPRLKIIF